MHRSYRWAGESDLLFFAELEDRQDAVNETQQASTDVYDHRLSPEVFNSVLVVSLDIA